MPISVELVDREMQVRRVRRGVDFSIYVLSWLNAHRRQPGELIV